jgi:hypothetical protein
MGDRSILLNRCSLLGFGFMLGCNRELSIAESMPRCYKTATCVRFFAYHRDEAS